METMILLYLRQLNIRWTYSKAETLLELVEYKVTWHFKVFTMFSVNVFALFVDTIWWMGNRMSAAYRIEELHVGAMFHKMRHIQFKTVVSHVFFCNSLPILDQISMPI